MICSVELPIKYLEYSDLFDYDFIIASTCLEHPEYLAYFMDAPNGSHRFTILDNGAFETGEAIDDRVYIDLARKLRPNVLVVPDVYQDGHATISRATEFLKVWEASPIPNVELMGVLQGDSWSALVAMYQTVYIHRCTYIGLPYATGVDRYQFLKAHPEIDNVHILGAPTLTEILALNLLPNVVSIDSSLPVKCTKDEKLLGKIWVSDSYTSPDADNLYVDILKKNLKMFTALCNGRAYVTYDKRTYTLGGI